MNNGYTSLDKCVLKLSEGLHITAGEADRFPILQMEDQSIEGSPSSMPKSNRLDLTHGVERDRGCGA